MLFSSKAAALALATTVGQSALVSSLVSPAGEGGVGAAAIKKTFEQHIKEQRADMFKKRRAARAVENEEEAAVDAAAPADAIADAGLLRGAKDEVLRGQRDLAKAAVETSMAESPPIVPDGRVSRKLQCTDPTLKRKQCEEISGCEWGGVQDGCEAIGAPCVGTTDCSACSKNRKTCEGAGCDWLKQGGASTCVAPCESGDPLTLSDACVAGSEPCPEAYNCKNGACGNIGCGSCIGSNSPLCQGHRGDIGQYSCLNGFQTCYYGVGKIGDGSCTGGAACYRAEVPVIGDGACNGAFACCGATVASIQSKFNDATKTTIEAGDCDGDKACCNPVPTNVCVCA